ncbi:hypothetical protein QG37_06493 [Candidozyma auris]|nr:hypothetical protein QG37_06493 [[Candida] auris]
MTGEEIVLDNVVGGEIIKIKHSLMKVVCEHTLVQRGRGRISLKLFHSSTYLFCQYAVNAKRRLGTVRILRPSSKV